VYGQDNSIDLKNTNPNQRAIHIHGGMEHNLVSIPNTTLMDAQKSQEVVGS